MMFLLLACVPKLPEAPQLSPYYQLPAAPHRNLPFQTEEEAVRAVKSTLGTVGLPEAADVKITWSEQAILARWSEGDEPEVVLGRFLLSPAEVRTDLNLLGGQFWSGPMKGLDSWNDADLETAYLLFSVGGLARELAHAVAFKRGAGDYEEAWLEEQRARTVEWSVISQMETDHLVPAGSTALWRRFYQTFRSSVPITSQPPDLESQKDTFRYGHDQFASPYTNDKSLLTAVAMGCNFSLEVSAKPPVADLAPLFARSPSRVRGLLERAVTNNLGGKATVNGSSLSYDGDGASYHIEVDEAQDRFQVVMRLPFVAAAPHLQELYRLINGLYRTDWRIAEHDYRFSVDDGAFSIIVPWTGLTPTGSPPEPDEVLSQLSYTGPLWLKGMIKVNSGLSTPEQVIYALSEGNEP